MNFPEIYQQYMYSYPHKTAYRPLKDIDLSGYLKKAAKQPLSLYFHLPFCESKCGYCNLFSVTGQTTETVSEYLASMRRQADYYRLEAPSLSFDSLTIGGGTPLYLKETQLEELFQIMALFSFSDHPEIIAETSPAQTTEEKLEILKQHRVNRVSIGIQSFQEEELLSLNRSHSVKECHHALSLIRDAGFPCRNIDLIYGIPHQDIRSFRYSIDSALFYEPEELFLYPLYIKRGTRLFNQQIHASRQAYELSLFMSDYLQNRGYTRLSMRRFVKKPPQAARSCGFENMLSLGCGGRSYLENLHFCTPYHVRQSGCLKEIKRYLKQTSYPADYGFLLSEEEMLRRYIIKNLLFFTGIDLTEYQAVRRRAKQSEASLWEDFPVFSELLSDHLVSCEKNKVFLTEKGMSLSDAVGPLFISKEVEEKMKEGQAKL